MTSSLGPDIIIDQRLCLEVTISASAIKSISYFPVITSLAAKQIEVYIHIHLSLLVWGRS